MCCNGHTRSSLLRNEKTNPFGALLAECIRNASVSASHQTAALSKLHTLLLFSGHGIYYIEILSYQALGVKRFFYIFRPNFSVSRCTILLYDHTVRFKNRIKPLANKCCPGRNMRHNTVFYTNFFCCR